MTTSSARPGLLDAQAGDGPADGESIEDDDPQATPSRHEPGQAISSTDNPGASAAAAAVLPATSSASRCRCDWSTSESGATAPPAYPSACSSSPRRGPRTLRLQAAHVLEQALPWSGRGTGLAAGERSAASTVYDVPARLSA